MGLHYEPSAFYDLKLVTSRESDLVSFVKTAVKDKDCSGTELFP